MKLTRSQLPKELQHLMVTQDDETLILDPRMLEMEYFASVDITKGDVWKTIQNYTNWICAQKIDVLKRKNEELKIANQNLTDEVEYTLKVYAELVTIVKNRNKDIDVSKICRDMRQQIEAAKRERERMETQELLTKAAIATQL